MLSNFQEFATNTSKLFTGGEGGVLPTMDYKGRLCLKGVPFQVGSRFMKRYWISTVGM